MKNSGASVPKTVVSFGPKSNAKSEALHQAAGVAEARYQQAMESTDKLSAQLRSAEDQIKELEARVRHHEGMADRAEDWLYQISLEIEEKFFSGAPALALR